MSSLNEVRLNWSELRRWTDENGVKIFPFFSRELAELQRAVRRQENVLNLNSRHVVQTAPLKPSFHMFGTHL